MEVVVTGRHCEVSDGSANMSRRSSPVWRSRSPHHARPGGGRAQKNPRQHDRATKVELTAFSKGPVIRAEAAAEDKMGALDLALDKMQAQMRRAADRRRVHKGRSARVRRGGPRRHADVDDAAEDEDGVIEHKVGPITVTGDGPLVVREKSHQPPP